MRADSQTGVLEDRTQEILQMDDSILSVASLEMINPFKAHFGTCDVLAAFYKDVKVLIVPLPPLNIHFVIVCLRSANAELIMCKFHEALAQIETINKSRNRPRSGIKA